ncbi:Aste57867_23383 [Aphanomyces stellatus]|uniref:Aste57867_23383 protein n=1 Tax=Aphanomyces stellatus TaxID=120398 RepID=A0A485LPF0_9STRA|nr:hypothetical protein As57867_023312 [Aphanomyces stellatus]VFU00029.1 Aste57867_23383 [Aphanomyces stellatus]
MVLLGRDPPMDVEFEAAAGIEWHSGEVGVSAETLRQASILPGSYVLLSSPNLQLPWLRRTRLTPTAPLANTSLVVGEACESSLPSGSPMKLHALPNHLVPTVDYIHLEWAGRSARPPAEPLLSMLVGAIFYDTMLWHCVSFGADYGVWRCRLGAVPTRPPSSLLPSELHQVPRFGVVAKTSQLTVSHGASCCFRILDAHASSTYVPTSTSQMLHEMASLHLTQPQPGLCSVLLHGPTGSGKTSAVYHVAREHHATVLEMDPTVVSLQTSLSLEQQFLACFSAALHMQPAIICIKHIELLFPKTLNGPGSQRIADFCGAIHALQHGPGARVVVVGTVVAMEHLFKKVRHCFTDELAMEPTTLAFRRQLLQSIFPTQAMNDKVANALLIQSGQQPGDIVSLVRHAMTQLVVQDEPLSLDRVVAAATSHAGKSNGPKADVTVPNVTWDDIGGAEETKQRLKEMVVWPFEKPEVFHRMGISPPIGLILYGPPGTGKTMLAKAAANATLCNFMNVTASDLMSSEFGESEKAITRVFQTARAMSPCIVFLDEFQSLFANRSSSGQIGSRMASQLLQEIDALRSLTTSEQYVFVLAATNALDAIDNAFLQPGRFENILYVGHPDAAGRLKILELMQRQMPWEEDDIELDDLVNDTDGLSSAEIVSVGRIAALIALATSSERVSMDHLRQALIETWERYHVERPSDTSDVPSDDEP